MCLACYPVTAPPALTSPAAPIRSVRFTVPNAYEDWSCYLSNQLQVMPPPPIVIPNPTSSKPAASAPAPEAAKDAPPPPKKTRPSKPPSLKAGATYVYPKRNTYVHLIRETKVWEEGRGKGGWGFKIHQVPISLSVGEFGEAMLETIEGWEVTEVVELGDGEWSKGTNVKLGDDRAKGTMGSFGWNERRGKELPPVWLVMHKG
ncbi:Hypothetical protein D9617_13g099270 [Elsinoe fawcettii]|nr:Hypothetical protein D9617_13g099270 [Elsinoe fawcettii]